LREKRAGEILQAAQQAVSVREGEPVLQLELRHVLARMDLLREQERETEGAIKEGLAKIPYAPLVRSLCGLGENTAAVILGELGDLRDYGSAEELIKVAGLNLYSINSGTQKGTVHITKRGRPLLRWALYLAASRTMKRGGVFHEFNERLKRNGKKGNERVVAVARKILRVLYAMVRDAKSFDPERLVSMDVERVAG
jgi:transposase